MRAPSFPPLHHLLFPSHAPAPPTLSLSLPLCVREQFSKTFHEGVDAFIKGDWPTAWQKLEGAAEFCPQDTPTKLLMKEMRARSIDPQTPTAPVDWKGYHDSEV